MTTLQLHNKENMANKRQAVIKQMRNNVINVLPIPEK